MSVESPRMLTLRGTVTAPARTGEPPTTRHKEPSNRLTATHAHAMTAWIRHMVGQAKPTAQRVSGTTSAARDETLGQAARDHVRVSLRHDDRQTGVGVAESGAGVGGEGDDIEVDPHGAHDDEWETTAVDSGGDARDGSFTLARGTGGGAASRATAPTRLGSSRSR